MKVIQIAVAGVAETPITQCEAFIYALTDEGMLYVSDNRSPEDWKRIYPPSDN